MTNQSTKPGQAQEDIEAFDVRMMAFEPEARTVMEAVEQTFQEVFPAAVDAVVESVPFVEDVIEGAAIIE